MQAIECRLHENLCDKDRNSLRIFVVNGMTLLPRKSRQFATCRERVHAALAMVGPSELKLERQLDRARAADLIERVESAVVTAPRLLASVCVR